MPYVFLCYYTLVHWLPHTFDPDYEYNVVVFFLEDLGLIEHSEEFFGVGYLSGP
jgi:hypothetical protein